MINIMKRIIFFFLTFSHSMLMGQVKDKTPDSEMVMPVIPGDFADPSVILVNGIYYAAGTSSEWAPHFPIFKSTDLIHWIQIGYIFQSKPSWTSGSFWAPELFYHDGKFLVYYVARRAVDNVSCIGLAVSDDPEKGFTDLGVILTTGKEAIDPFIFRDNNDLYISWKAYGLDNRPIELLSARLSEDGRKVVGEPYTLLKDFARKGLEGQCLIKEGKYYYLFYSVGNCCGSACSYYVNVARSTSIKGPFTDHPGNPVLRDNGYWKCPGHGTLVKGKDNHWYFMYHAYSRKDNVFTGRQGMLASVSWKNGWPVLNSASANQQILNDWDDSFDQPVIGNPWQWDFRNAAPAVKLENGTLCLSGTWDSLKNQTGIAITTRPYAGNYEVTTEIVNRNSSVKGLVIYGDAGESAGIGLSGSKVQVWVVQKNVRRVLAESDALAAGSVSVRIGLTNEFKLRFFWRIDHSSWNEINTGNSFLDGGFLPPWDRSPRPGLHVRGKETDPGCFSYFKIDYKDF